MINPIFSPKNIFLFLVILLFLPSIINIFRLILTTFSYQEVMNNLYDGKLAEAIEDFPVHETSLDAYLKSKYKIDSFIDFLSQNQSAELILSQEELNDFYTKGKTINKYVPGTYIYYQINEGKIVEISIEGPSNLPPNPYFTKTREIYFSSNSLEEYFVITEENGKKINDRSLSYSLEKSSLICFIMGIIDFPDRFPFKFKKSNEYQKGLVLLNKLKNIEINNNSLVLKS